MAFRPEFRVLRNNQEPFEKRHTVIRVICSRRIMVRFGYACINSELRAQNIFTNRKFGSVARAIDAGLEGLSERALLNVQDLERIVHWNAEHDVEVFRISSEMFSHITHPEAGYQLEDLPDYDEIAEVMARTGRFAQSVNQRLSFHPGPFNVLGSTRDSVVAKTVIELNHHGKVMDMLAQPRNHLAKINIHVGTGQGNALERFARNVDMLDESVRSRLTVENDDRASLHSVAALAPMSHDIDVPVVFDYHHHLFCDGGLSEQQALELALDTWSVRPCTHYSESAGLEVNNPKFSGKPTPAHSILVEGPVETYGHDFDCVVEAKGKELAMAQLL